MISGINKNDFIKIDGTILMVLLYEGNGLYRCIKITGSQTGHINSYTYEYLCKGEHVYSDEQLREEIDNNNEIIQSLHDEIEARKFYTQKVIAQRNHLQEEINAMAKDHEAECEDFIEMINEQIDVENLHIILAKYLTDNYTPESAKICLFQFLDEIKEYIDSNKNSVIL